MLHFISRWARTSPSVVIVKTLLQVDPTCPTELEILLADDCQNPLIYSTVLLHPNSVTEKRGNIIIPIISGTVLGVLVAVTIIVISIIGCVVLCKAKQTNTHRNL